jgi:hypothetical protein
MMRRLRVVARVAPQVPALHLQICIIVNLGACCLQRSQQCSAVAERCAAARPVRKAGRLRADEGRRLETAGLTRSLNLVRDFRVSSELN